MEVFIVVDVRIAPRTCSKFDPQAIEFLLRDPTGLVRSLEQHGRTLGPQAGPTEVDASLLKSLLSKVLLESPWDLSPPPQSSSTPSCNMLRTMLTQSCSRRERRCGSSWAFMRLMIFKDDLESLGGSSKPQRTSGSTSTC